MSEVVKNRPRYGVMRLVDATGYRLPLAVWFLFCTALVEC
jgi:hypothetical protein